MVEPTVVNCADWLRGYLSIQRSQEVAHIYRVMRADGFSRRLVRAAKNQLKLVVTSQLENGKRVFYWRLP